MSSSLFHHTTDPTPTIGRIIALNHNIIPSFWGKMMMALLLNVQMCCQMHHAYPMIPQTMQTFFRCGLAVWGKAVSVDSPILEGMLVLTPRSFYTLLPTVTLVAFLDCAPIRYSSSLLSTATILSKSGARVNTKMSNFLSLE